MIKRLLILCACLFFCNAMTIAAPVYWLAQKGHIELLIIGSIHVGNREMYPLPSEVEQFLDHSDGLILETDLNQADTIQIPPLNQSTESVLTDEQRIQFGQLCRQLNLSEPTLLQTAPWRAAITLQIEHMDHMGYQAHYGVDQYLLQEANRRHLPILGLESIQSQIDLLASLPNEGKDLLLEVMAGWQSQHNDIQCLVTSWEKGDQQNLLNFVSRGEQESSEVEDKINTHRNRLWASLIDSGQFFPRQYGKYLMTVGTMHLLGRDNLIDLLKRRQFHITERRNSQPANCRFSQ